MTTCSAEKALVAAEAARSKIRDRAEVTRTQLAQLRSDIVKARDAYRDELASAELGQAPAPDRAALVALQQREPELEDLLAGVERALAEADRAWRAAQAVVLEEEADAIYEESGRREARITELQAAVELLLNEQAEHHTWISNSGPVQATKLRARAHELRTT